MQQKRNHVSDKTFEKGHFFNPFPQRRADASAALKTRDQRGSVCPDGINTGSAERWCSLASRKHRSNWRRRIPPEG